MASPAVEMAGPVRARPSWVSFGMWTIVGAGFAVGGVGYLSIGLFVLPASLLLTLIVARWRGVTADAIGILSGIALPLFYVAFINRQGPGTVCTSIPRGTSCTDESSPWPWLVTGIVLMAVGLSVFLTRRHHSRTSPDPTHRA